MIQRRQLADIRVLIASDLDGKTIRLVDNFLSWYFADQFTPGIRTLRDQTSKFIFGLDR
jgi:hypothetical protein